MMCERCGGVQAEEKEILNDNGSAREKGCCEGWVFLDAGPGEIDVEEQEKDSQPDNGPLSVHAISS